MSQEVLTRTFNTALVVTRARSQSSSSDSGKAQELSEVVQSPAFKSLLKATEIMVEETGCTEKEAAEQIIETFRSLDDIWTNYLLKEGFEKLKGSGLQDSSSANNS